MSNEIKTSDNEIASFYAEWNFERLAPYRHARIENPGRYVVRTPRATDLEIFSAGFRIAEKLASRE